MQARKDIVLAAVSQNGWALQEASEELRRDHEVRGGHGGHGAVKS